MLRFRFIAPLFAVLVSLLFMGASPAHAGPSLVVAQEDAETEGETDEGGAGQSEPEAETESGAEGSEPAETETGPPWTYQMARMGLVLLVFLGLSIGAAYYRFVASRQRGAA